MNKDKVDINYLNGISYIIKKVEQLTPGDIILHPIYREDGLMLINRYTALSILYIKQISIHLKSNTPIIIVSSKEKLEEFLNEKLYADARFIKELEKVISYFKKNSKVPISIYSYADSRVNLELYMKRGEEGPIEIEEEEYLILTKIITSSPLWSSFEMRLESKRLQERARDIKDQILDVIYKDKSLLDLINKMKNYDDLLIIHGVNSACISILIGLTLELLDKDLIDLAISTLFCNIGFIKVEKDTFYSFLKNPNHEDLIDSHIKDSLEIMASNSKYCRNKNIVYGILDHHEHYSGGGYPAGKESNEISLFGRIIAIAMMYDELVGGYLESPGILSTKATNTMWENKDKRLDPSILKIYAYRSNLYKVGESYYNSTGDKGVIIGFSNYIDEPHKPIVRFNNDTIIDYSGKSLKL